MAFCTLPLALGGAIPGGASRGGVGGGGDGDTPPCQPRYRRSKLLLTRRVYSLRPARRSRGRGSSPPPPTPPPPPPPPDPLPPVAPASPEPFRPEPFLDPASPVPAYFFARGSLPYPARRRSGDPPARFLELRHGLVGPDSPHVPTCADPRPSRRLKRWYANAIRWRVLHRDYRPVFPLSADRLIAPRPSSDDSAPSNRRPSTRRAPGDIEPPSSSSPAAPVTALPPKPPPGGHSSAAAPLPLSPLLLLDATSTARALAHSPRVIVVGDVHGCIDELQALLRLADFQPGDQVVLLGDLVAKGPDSVGVVQMARDIGARSVRGNHDHEVIRWCEASAKGVRNAMISLEHSRIANALSPEDHAWLLELPWFISSPETSHLFVHAGFIPGVKLTQQNPRLMMNMRSVLNDGTVTAKNVADCEWAKLWRGPQTVVFGHDAHRGLQEHPFAKGIDTGCVYGGRLTALILPEKRYISVGAKRSYIKERRFRR